MKYIEQPKTHQRWIYNFTRVVLTAFFRLFWRVEIHGHEHIPMTGSALVAANHVSLADPPLIGTFLQRNIYFFAKQELFEIPVIGWYITQLNAFPVKRYEHDIAAFKRAQNLVTQGHCVLLFPEGQRSPDGELQKAKPGVGMLAYKTGAPVIPMYLKNTRKMKSFCKVEIFIGPPLPPPAESTDRDRYQRFSDEVLNAIAALKPK